jgi:dihydrolipoamide dehydrogenase
MADEKFDLVVIGGGPGGYVAAIRAAQLGLKTACVESRGALGGTCLNVGCIPSKALLESSEMYQKVKHAADYGVMVKECTPDVPAMIKRKDSIVSQLTKGVEGLFRKNKVTYLAGKGSFVSKNQIKVTKADGTSQILQASNVIIATGSEPIELPFAKFDGDVIISSTEALDFNNPPKTMIVIGGGVIGLEMGSVWGRLGSKVTVIEAMPEILFNMDASIQKGMRRILEKQGFKFLVDTKVQEIKATKKKGKIKAKSKDGVIELEADKILVAVGRKPYTSGLDLEKAGVQVDQRARVQIDEHFKTNVQGIYAIGDVVRGAMLAHKAEEEGVAAAEIIAQKPGHVNYEAIPSVIYTWPEVAAVGATEAELKERSTPYRVGQFSFMANGRAKCAGNTDGFVRIIAHEKTDRLLGVHIIGPNASELIAEVAIAFEFGASAEDLARSVHAHPTLAEAIKEAAFAVDKRTIHS